MLNYKHLLLREQNNMNYIKIAIVASRFPPQGDLGGIEIANQDISDQLVKRGHDVSLIASGEKNTIEKLSNKVKIYRVVNPNVKVIGTLFFWLNAFFALKKIKPDIVHCQTIQMAFPAFLYKKIYKKPYIVWCHGHDVYFSWAFKKSIFRMVLPQANAIVVLTDHMKQELQKNCKYDIVVIPNGINTQKFKGFSKSSIRAKYNVPIDQKIILFVGALKPVKGIRYLIEAFKIICQKIPEAKLIIVGDDFERQSLESIVKQDGLEEKVDFIGRVLHDKIPEYLALADVFVLPSLSEGLPVVILEAMSSGLPVVATNVRGVPEIINDGENGFLVEPKNSQQIVDKILMLLKNDLLQEKISNNNKEKAKKYDWENIIIEIEKIYFNVLNNNK